jgi:Protein of unknown function (DUF2852)
MNPVMWLDDFGKPAWIALIVISFILFWPAGLVVLGYLIGSGRMGCWTRQWSRHVGEGWQTRMQERAAQWGGARRADPSSGPSSGNSAFDEYRAETLRRLEEEQSQFREFLERLRQAKDKAEFDQFMAEMRRRSEGPMPQPGG